MVASQTLRAALTKAEQSNPGLTFELVKGIIRKFFILSYLASVHISSSNVRQQIKGTSMLTCTRAFLDFRELNKLFPTPQTVSIVK